MADVNTNATTQEPMSAMAFLAPTVGWFFPGAGHLIQGRWIRGLILMFCVIAMFFIGLAAQGKIYSPNAGDILQILAFIGDMGAGSLYIVARLLDWGRGAIELASADYGTTFIVVAGLLNVIAAVDAHQIALGKKP